MKILLMTDLEGVAGVKNWVDWCGIDSRFYAQACRLLTGEVNAAVDGFFAGGATYIEVADGHGPGGIDVELLDPRSEYARGWPEGTWPFGLDSSFDGLAFVGQHPKAGTEFGHLCHTQNFSYIDLSVNGLSIGEFGQLTLCAGELGVPVFFASGDLAFTQEAEALVPGITVCAVKRGVTSGSGDECFHEAYRMRNAGAVHKAPARACGLIRAAAENAVKALLERPPGLCKLDAPFHLDAVFRPEKEGEKRTVARTSHPLSFIELMKSPIERKPLSE